MNKPKYHVGDIVIKASYWDWDNCYHLDQKCKVLKVIPTEQSLYGNIWHTYVYEVLPISEPEVLKEEDLKN